ncbi:hypothetical protein R69776_05170 [Paraburkholderia nemoris]|uniref:Uncharacterized protein n=1 Tax=Paraburkholderia nemoris TaxID=2793076 RepID=A0ABM8SBQ4_9BURK|nr:hypothetical protein R75777_00017 [Paraburkholderia nemoris]CAE6799983.1 hypothetical protein R69776_05170 [Paraburkholderia nemoris]
MQLTRKFDLRGGWRELINRYHGVQWRQSFGAVNVASLLKIPLS